MIQACTDYEYRVIDQAKSAIRNGDELRLEVPGKDRPKAVVYVKQGPYCDFVQDDLFGELNRDDAPSTVVTVVGSDNLKSQIYSLAVHYLGSALQTPDGLVFRRAA